MTITEERLAAWERLASKATPGPWEVETSTKWDESSVKLVAPDAGRYECVVADTLNSDLAEIYVEDGDQHVDVVGKRNLEFCAAAREAVPALLAEIRALRSAKADHLAIVDRHRPVVEDKDRAHRVLSDYCVGAGQDVKSSTEALAWFVVGRAREGDELADRAKTVADEAFGPFPVQDAEEALSAVERGCFEARQERDALRDCLRDLLASPGRRSDDDDDPHEQIERRAAHLLGLAEAEEDRG